MKEERDSRLKTLVEKMVSIARKISPQAKIEVSYTSIEGEDATITVYCPSDWDFERCEALQERLSKKSLDTLLKENLHILPLVIEPQERVRREIKEFRKSLKEKSQILPT